MLGYPSVMDLEHVLEGEKTLRYVVRHLAVHLCLNISLQTILATRRKTSSCYDAE